jgi:hypothetical protein
MERFAINRRGGTAGGPLSSRSRKSKNIGIPHLCWGHGPSGTHAGKPSGCATLLQATHRGTPPEDLQRSRQVSWLAGHCGCLAFPIPLGISDTFDSRSPLTVAGAASVLDIAFQAAPSPNSLLASTSLI